MQINKSTVEDARSHRQEWQLEAVRNVSFLLTKYSFLLEMSCWFPLCFRVSPGNGPNHLCSRSKLTVPNILFSFIHKEQHFPSKCNLFQDLSWKRRTTEWENKRNIKASYRVSVGSAWDNHRFKTTFLLKLKELEIEHRNNFFNDVFK